MSTHFPCLTYPIGIFNHFTFEKQPCDQQDHLKTLACLDLGVLVRLALTVGGESSTRAAVSHL